MGHEEEFITFHSCAFVPFVDERPGRGQTVVKNVPGVKDPAEPDSGNDGGTPSAQ
jgi:hypothetical protein